MQRLEVSGAVRPIYGSLGVKRLIYFLGFAPPYPTPYPGSERETRHQDKQSSAHPWSSGHCALRTPLRETVINTASTKCLDGISAGQRVLCAEHAIMGKTLSFHHFSCENWVGCFLRKSYRADRMP